MLSVVNTTKFQKLRILYQTFNKCKILAGEIIGVDITYLPSIPRITMVFFWCPNATWYCKPSCKRNWATDHSELKYFGRTPKMKPKGNFNLNSLQGSIWLGAACCFYTNGKFSHGQMRTQMISHFLWLQHWNPSTQQTGLKKFATWLVLTQNTYHWHEKLNKISISKFNTRI